MTSLSLAHSSGISDQPLLDFSIGAALRNAVARFYQSMAEGVTNT
jgi:hypothetical protein